MMCQSRTVYILPEHFLFFLFVRQVNYRTSRSLAKISTRDTERTTKMKVAAVFLSLAVFILSSTLVHGDDGIRDVDENQMILREKRDAYSQDLEPFIRKKRSETFLTNVFTGGFEIAKNAAAIFVDCIKKIYAFSSYWLAELTKRVAESSKKTIPIAKKVINFLLDKLGYVLKKTFIIGGDLKNYIFKKIEECLPNLEKNILKALTTAKNALSKFYDTVTKYLKSVYDRAEDWNKNNKQMAEKAKAEGGQVITAQEYNDKSFIPAVENNMVQVQETAEATPA